MSATDTDTAPASGDDAKSAAPEAEKSTATKAPAAKQHSGWMRIVMVLSSMKLAVVLLVVLGLLTWLGTLAQIKGGLWATQKEYFESWGLIAELPLSWWGSGIPTPEDPWVIRIPLPGAYPVMALLFVNLLVGGMVRLKWRARNAGVLITHVGIALLLVAGFVKMEYSYSGHLALFETPTSGPEVPIRQYESSTFVSFHDHELALMKDNGDSVEERVVPEAQLLGAIDETVTITGEGLPFELELHHYLVNCRALAKGPMIRATTPVLDVEGGGPGVFLQPNKIQPKREHNRPGVYVRVMVRGEQHAEGIIWGPNALPRSKIRFPFVFELEGQRWAVDLRNVMYELPFSMRLSKFVKRDHPGTMTPADFRSWVSVDDGGEKREVQIYMNTPLRKDGYVAYQTNWGPQQPGPDGRPMGPPWFSEFEVAANPSDQWPMWSCWVIGLGLVVHMVMKLRRFLSSSARTSLSA